MKRILFFLLFISLAPAIFAEETMDDKDAKLIEALRKYAKSQQNSISVSKDTAQLVEAVGEGNLPLVKTALANGADIRVKNRKGDTLLFLAIEKGRTEIVAFLLDNGFGINDEDSTGRTPLLAAAYRGHTETVKFLLDKGAEVNPKNDYGFTPLMAAADNGYLEIVKLLLDKGADVNAKHKTGNTALIGAARISFPETGLFPKNSTEVNPQEQNNRTEIVKLLLDKGAEVNAKSENGYTALITAAELGRTEIVKLLLDRGADVNARTNEGLTAIEQAKRAGRTDIVQLLQKTGTNVGMQYYLMLGHKFLDRPDNAFLVMATIITISILLLSLFFRPFALIWKTILISYIAFAIFIIMGKLYEHSPLGDTPMYATLFDIVTFLLLVPGMLIYGLVPGAVKMCPSNFDEFAIYTIGFLFYAIAIWGIMKAIKRHRERQPSLNAQSEQEK